MVLYFEKPETDVETMTGVKCDNTLLVESH